MKVTRKELAAIYAEKGSINGVATQYGVNYTEAHQALIEYGLVQVKLSEEDISMAVSLFNQGASATVIRKKFKKQAYEISHILRTHPDVTREVRQGRRKLTPEAELDICRRYMERERVLDICAAYGFDRKYLYHVLGRNNVDKTKRKLRRKCDMCGATDGDAVFPTKSVHKCKPCYDKTVGRRKRDKAYRKRYNIGIEDYDELLNIQGGKCALCREHDAATNGRNLAVDHVHDDSAAIRGLLCVTCNVKLGVIEGAGLDLSAVVDYLANPPAAAITSTPTDDAGQGLLF